MPALRAVARRRACPRQGAGQSRSRRAPGIDAQSGIAHPLAGGSDIQLRLRCRESAGQYVGPSFKWIKQHLRIKAFFGTSENAVKTQIWIAVATYVLIAIVKKRAMLPHSLYELLQILSLTMFETTPINQLLTPPPLTQDDDQQLVLL